MFPTEKLAKEQAHTILSDSQMFRLWRAFVVIYKFEGYFWVAFINKMKDIYKYCPPEAHIWSRGIVSWERYPRAEILWEDWRVLTPLEIYHKIR